MEMPKEFPADMWNQMNSINMMNPMNSMNMMNSMNSMDMMEQMKSMNIKMNQMNQVQKSSQNSNNDSNDNNNSTHDQGINVSFWKMDGQKKFPYNIQCLLSDQISDIIQKYKNLSSDNDTSNTFIFYGKELNLNVTADEAGFFNQAVIFVMTTNTTK